MPRLNQCRMGGNGQGQGRRGNGRRGMCRRNERQNNGRQFQGLGLNRNADTCRFSNEEIAENLKVEIKNTEEYLQKLKSRLEEIN